MGLRFMRVSAVDLDPGPNKGVAGTKGSNVIRISQRRRDIVIAAKERLRTEGGTSKARSGHPDRRECVGQIHRENAPHAAPFPRRQPRDRSIPAALRRQKPVAKGVFIENIGKSGREDTADPEADQGPGGPLPGSFHSRNCGPPAGSWPTGRRPVQDEIRHLAVP